MIPRLHRSHFLSYENDSPTHASTTSGAMYSADPTGVRSSGVLQESFSLLTGMPLAKSKSQILIGTTSSRFSHRMLSGLRSRCAIPGNVKNKIEPSCDKTNKVSVRPAKTQISLGIRPVWSESSLSPWRKLGSLATHWAHSKDWSDWADAQADLSLCWAHNHIVGFVTRQLNCELSPSLVICYCKLEKNWDQWKFAVIILKFEEFGFTVQQCVQSCRWNGKLSRPD